MAETQRKFRHPNRQNSPGVEEDYHNRHQYTDSIHLDVDEPDIHDDSDILRYSDYNALH